MTSTIWRRLTSTVRAQSCARGNRPSCSPPTRADDRALSLATPTITGPLPPRLPSFRPGKQLSRSVCDFAEVNGAGSMAPSRCQSMAPSRCHTIFSGAAQPSQLGHVQGRCEVGPPVSSAAQQKAAKRSPLQYSLTNEVYLSISINQIELPPSSTPLPPTPGAPVPRAPEQSICGGSPNDHCSTLTRP